MLRFLRRPLRCSGFGGRLRFRKRIVQHNQNETLRPNEKMIRTVCLNCHGTSFSIDSLADDELIEKDLLVNHGNTSPASTWLKNGSSLRRKRKGRKRTASNKAAGSHRELSTLVGLQVGWALLPVHGCRARVPNLTISFAIGF